MHVLPQLCIHMIAVIVRVTVATDMDLMEDRDMQTQVLATKIQTRQEYSKTDWTFAQDYFCLK